MTLSIYLPVAGRSPQQHAPLSTHQTVPSTILRTTKYWKERTTKSTPALLCTTKYNSCTTLNYKVLLKYYFSTTPYTTKSLWWFDVVFVKLQCSWIIFCYYEQFRFSLLVIPLQFIACDIFCNDSWWCLDWDEFHQWKVACNYCTRRGCCSPPTMHPTMPNIMAGQPTPQPPFKSKGLKMPH